MGKDNNVLKTLDSLSVSRRSFMKGLAAIGALGAVAGCSNSDDNSVIQTGGAHQVRVTFPVLILQTLLSIILPAFTTVAQVSAAFLNYM